MNDRIGVGVLGAGGDAAYGHLLGLELDDRAEIVAAWDINADKLADRAREFGIPTQCASLEELLALPEVDAVVIATPDHLHAQHAIAALRAGKHVLCEKPTSTTRDDAAGIVAAQRESGRVFLGGHVYHFRPDYQLLAKAYQDGDVGEAFLVEGDYVSNLQHLYGETGRTPWRSDATNPQNIMIGGGCHPLGLMRWVLQDEIVEVSAFSNHLSEPLLPADDCYVAILKFKGGAVGRLCAASGSRGHVPDGGYIKVRGTRGSLWNSALYRDDNEYHSPWPIRDFAYETQYHAAKVSRSPQSHHWGEQISHFLDCIEGKAEPMTSALDSARVVAALTACVESARTGQTVLVDNEF